jgi:hypothetical protein
LRASISRRRGLVGGVLLLAVALGLLSMLSGPADAQPAEGPGRPCAPGELCVPDEVPEPGEAEEGSGGPVNDPPGRYLRSISTMALVALIVGTYFFVALTGKRLRLKR